MNFNRGDNRTALVRETGSIKKKWKGKLPVALIFPNSYQLGMSNLGFQLIYRMLNSLDDLVCERVFLPPNSQSQPLSVESNRPLSDFPVLFFSISFEMDFPGVISILDGAAIEALAEERAKAKKIAAKSPLVIGGGVATFINPEPLAPFFDLLVIGEAEPILPPLMAKILAPSGLSSKSALLDDIAKTLPGAYVPSYYQPIYNEDGTLQGTSVASGFPAKIKKIKATQQVAAGHSAILAEDTEFSNIFLTELGRGCSRGCRFCAAGFVYRPPRLWSAESIINAVEQRYSGANRVGLIGMEMAQEKDLEIISKYLLQESCALSFSSLRADRINSSLMELLAESVLKSAAIAPDGGSERLRRVISKNITEDDVTGAAEALVRSGVKNLKLYYMIGLPTETMADLDEMVRFILVIRDKITEIGRARGHLSNIYLSINSFVPKAWTPFQFFAFTPVAELKKRIKFIRKKLAGIANLKISVDNPDKAYFQAVLARGDRKVGMALLEVARQEKNWRQVLAKQGIDPKFYGQREREKNEMFPWEIIDNGLNKNYLWQEYQMALKGKDSRGCSINEPGSCRRCGVCHD